MRGVARRSMRAALTATPGPNTNGPRRAKRRRFLDASAAKSPFLVPIQRTTRSGMLTSGDCGHDGDDVARCERRVKASAGTDVVAIHEQVDVAAHGSRLIADAAIERRMVAFELLKGGAHRRSRQGYLAGAGTARTQHAGDENRNRHGAP